MNVRQDVKESDHAPLCVTLTMDTRRPVSASQLLERASLLGQSHRRKECGNKLQRSARYKAVDMEVLIRTLQEATTGGNAGRRGSGRRRCAFTFTSDYESCRRLYQTGTSY